MLAEITQEVPWHIVGFVMLGLIGIGGVVALALTIIEKSQRVFGKHPPVEDELRHIHDKISHGHNALTLRVDEAEEKIAATREELQADINERFTTLAIDRQRTLDHLYSEGINPIRDSVSRILGKLEEMDRHR